jgi:hypothetical protein
MRSAPPWIRRGLIVILVAAGILIVARALGDPASDDGLVPAIGGDTWPPVPIKSGGPA